MTKREALERDGFTVVDYVDDDGAALVAVSFSISDDDIEEYAAILEIDPNDGDAIDDMIREIEDSRWESLFYAVNHVDCIDVDSQHWSDFETVHSATFTLAELSGIVG